MKPLSRLLPLLLLPLFLPGTGCLSIRGMNKEPEIKDEHAEAVVVAARTALGHDSFTVAYVPNSPAMLGDSFRQGLSPLIGSSDAVRGMAAGLAENHDRRMDVVVEGANPGAVDSLVRSALKVNNKPLPGLDIVLLSPPSGELRELAAKFSITLHTIKVAP
jgi:hypothetical protein